MELISKKDLLAQTGISYGQLYRWKRQGLIPEEWFIKRSAFTGQETFFPKEQILHRVSSILEMKDRYSLKEVAAILSPRDDGARLARAELTARGVDDGLFRMLDKEDYGYMECVYLMALTLAAQRNGLPRYIAAGLARAGLSAAARAGQDAVVTFFKAGGGGYHAVFTREPPAFDEGVDVLAQYGAADVAGILQAEFGGEDG